jgi:hypothetical protein
VRTWAAAVCPLTGGAADHRLLVAAGGGGGASAVSSGGGVGGDAGPAPQGGGAGTAVAGAGGGQGGGAGTEAVGGAAGVAGVGTQTSPGQQGSVGVGGASQAIGVTTQSGGGGGGRWFGGGSGGNGAWTNGQVGGGGGGGAGSGRVTSAASDVQIAVDAAGTPSVTIAYTPDTTPPEIDNRTPGAGAAASAGQTVPADYTCADPAGVTRCDGDVPAAALADTATAGEHTFTVTATDAAGNTQARTVHYTVSAPTVTPAPTPIVTPRPPGLTISARRRSLNTVVSSCGFLLSVRCDVWCDVRASATVGRRTAGSGTRQLSAGTMALLRIRLTSSAVRSLKRRGSSTFVVAVRATAVSRAGDQSAVSARSASTQSSTAGARARDTRFSSACDADPGGAEGDRARAHMRFERPRSATRSGSGTTRHYR